MLSPSPEPILNDPIYTKRALLTIEAFLQGSTCPESTWKMWLYLKMAINELSTIPSTPITSTQVEILTRLSAIEKKLSALTVMLPKQSTYADHTRKALSQSVNEKLVLGRDLKEVTVKVIRDPKPSQTSERLVESIYAAHSNKAGKVIAAQKLKNEDICVSTDSYETKTLLEQEDGETQVIAGRTKVQGRQFAVMAQSVKINRIDTKNQEKALAELQAQNPQLKGKAKFLRVAWMKSTLKDGKLYGRLLIDVETPEDAHSLVSEGLVHDHEQKYCKLFHSKCNMPQCYKC